MIIIVVLGNYCGGNSRPKDLDVVVVVVVVVAAAGGGGRSLRETARCGAMVIAGSTSLRITAW
jgi:hypothetical protein